MYFHAGWNPICKQVDQRYKKFAGDNAAFTHIKVDCDKNPQLKFFFDVRVEPQILLLLNGVEFKR